MASNAEQTGDLPVRTDNPIELIEQRQGISKSTTEFQLVSFKCNHCAFIVNAFSVSFSLQEIRQRRQQNQ